ncbi:MAG: ABC transporter permease subunit [Acidimicrobiales bacterium]
MVLATWFTNQLIYDGVVFGLVYGLLALGIVLIYRSTRVINFAVGNMGLPGAVLFALMIFNWSFPFWIAIVIALLVGTLYGLIIDVAVIRRLFNSPRVILLVATIGIAQLSLAIVFAYPDLDVDPGQKYPRFIGSEWEDVLGSGIDVTGSELVVLILVPLLAIGLSWFLYRTTVGQTVQAAADNSDLARLSGISPRVVSMLIWSIAGFLSTISMIMLSQLSGSTSAATFQNIGPNTMVRALAAAVIGGMRSFTGALAAGIAVGIIQALLRFNFLSESGLVDFVLFIAVLIAVFWQSRSDTESTQSSFSFAPKIRAIPARLRGVNTATVGLFGAIALGIAIIGPLVVDTPSRHFLYASIVCFAICAASVTVITGWSGQLSLGQMAFAGLGALGAAALTRGVELDIGWGDTRLIQEQFKPIPFVLAIFLVPLFTAAVAALIGIGGLRVRGLMLAVTTFAFGLAAQQYLYRRPVFSDGNSQSVPFDRGQFFGIDLTSQRSYYFFSLAILMLVLAVLSRLRKSGVGRNIIAVRDNPDSAAAYTVAPVRTKLMAFAMAGGIAGLGGAVLGGLVRNIPFTERFFLTEDSLRLVAMVVIGGLGSVVGPVIGAVWVQGLPAFFPDNEVVPLVTSSIGLLVLLLYFPGGFVQIYYSARDAWMRWLEARIPEDPHKTMSEPPSSIRGSGERPPLPEVALEARNLDVRFGGNHAVNSAEIEVRGGEVVGLIGTNGAGKSTLMNAVGGYVSSTGKVQLMGEDVSGLRPEARSRLGLGRTFQAALLFPELTVSETVQVALEGRGRSGVVSTALFLPHTFTRERRRRTEASELIDFLGLGRYSDTYISDLSTGTRRIVELAGLLALDARVLCLDEPTAGVAQRETEAFGPLMLRIRDELDASMLIIEHDMPLIMSLSDRVYCLEAGQVISEGDPDTVRNDPAVVASYLGTDERAIERSDS